jgi:chorismate dehydratase
MSNPLIGVVPYINAIPLTHGLPYDVRNEAPAILDRLMSIGELDIATAPVISLFDHPEWQAIPGIAIGTTGSARSVLFCTRSPNIDFQNVKKIQLDVESRTSNLLLKVLLRCKYGRSLDDIEFIESDPAPEMDARIIIGDKALREHKQPTWTGSFYDLGQEWTAWTKLPFVFACWVSRKSNIDSQLVATLQWTVDKNIKTVDSWVTNIEDFNPVMLSNYFTKNMNYRFGSDEMQGLMTFHQYLRELEIYDRPYHLNLVRP